MFEIAKKAMEIFGNPISVAEEDRQKYLSKISNNYNNNPWENCDSDFYECDENIEILLMNYVNKNINSFCSGKPLFRFFYI
ncbi:MAG: DUF4375 domain-containing protein, partial [Candidatus Babeliaceae bacterium]|nr:DUF4375 domain-containing protein [Candidatus Babeliaceae bacterium]